LRRIHSELISVVVLSIHVILVDSIVKTLKPHLHILERLKELALIFTLLFDCLLTTLETAGQVSLLGIRSQPHDSHEGILLFLELWHLFLAIIKEFVGCNWSLGVR
jgi:hypothetical protein